MAENIGFTDCCGASIMYGFETLEPEQAEREIRKRMPLAGPGMVFVILNGAENNRLEQTFVDNGFERVGAVIKNPNTGHLLFTYVCYKVGKQPGHEPKTRTLSPPEKKASAFGKAM